MTHSSQHDVLSGTWRLVSVEVRYEGADTIYPWGSKPEGHIVYATDGYMSAVIARADRTLFATSDLLAGSIEEQAEAARSYLSYGGTYQVHGDKVIHYVDVSLFPNWVGVEQVRFIEHIDEDKLILRTPPMPLAGKTGAGYLIWQRHRSH